MGSVTAWPPTPPSRAPDDAGDSTRVAPPGRRPGPDRPARRQVRRGPRPVRAQPRRVRRRSSTRPRPVDATTFRERVRDVVVEMAATGPDRAWASPRSTAAAATSAPRSRPSRPWRSATCRCWSRSACSSGSSAARSCSSGTKRHHDAYLADLVTGELMGCFAMTETGHGSNVQALGTVATYDADDPGVRDHHPGRRGRARTTSATRPRTPSVAVVFAQLEVGGESAGRARVRRADPRRERRAAARRPDRGRRPQDRPQRRRQRPASGSTTCGCRAPALLNRYADVTPRTALPSSDIENPDRRFFTMLGTLVQGRVCVGGAGINAAKVALAIAVKYADAAPPVRATDAEEEELLLDYGMHQRRLLPLLARTYALHFAQEVLLARSCTTCFSGTEDARARQRRELESRAAGTKALGTWHATRTIQECREACGGAGYLIANRFAALQGRHRRLHHLRGRQPRPAAAGGQGPAHRLLRDVRGPRPARHGALRGRPRRRDRRRAHQRAQAARADQGRAARRRRQLGPGGRPARPGVPARDAALARGAHARRRRPPAQARHRRRHGPRRGLQPGAGPRDRGRPAPTSSGWCSRRSSTRSRRCPRATTRPRSALLCDLLRAVHDRGRPRVVHGARPADQRSARRRSAARSRRCAAAPADRGGPRRRLRRSRRRCCAPRSSDARLG